MYRKPEKRNGMLICPFCELEWKPRKAQPRACPRCRRYFTWEEKKRAK